MANNRVSATVGDEPTLEVDKERRFLVSTELADHIAALAGTYFSPQLYHQTRPLAFTRTTYFDTAEHDLYRSRRPHCRVRLREYACAAAASGCPQFTGVSYLELKSTTAATRTKIRIGTTGHDLHSAAAFQVEWQRLLAVIPAELSLARGLRHARLAPCVTTHYQRRSFRSGDHSVRVTIDSELAMSSPILVAQAPAQFQPATSIGYGAERIVEIKSKNGVPRWLDDVVGDIREERAFSKFRWGVATLYPEAAALTRSPCN